jgi:ABC-type Fe3+ transport system permease subunit
VNERYERVAATLGASPARIFLTISLPLAWPSVLGGAVLAFARALGEFGATIVVAGSIPGATRTLAVAIYSYAETGRTPGVRSLLVSVAIAFVALWRRTAWSRGARRDRVDIELRRAHSRSPPRHARRRAAALFGPSGAGKTTILDAIAGLRTPRRGSIAIDGRVLFSSRRASTSRRTIATSATCRRTSRSSRT